MRPRGGLLLDEFRAGMHRAGVPALRREERTVAGSAFSFAPRSERRRIPRRRAGVLVRKEQAIAEAAQRWPGVKYVGADARWFCFEEVSE